MDGVKLDIEAGRLAVARGDFPALRRRRQRTPVVRREAVAQQFGVGAHHPIGNGSLAADPSRIAKRQIVVNRKQDHRDYLVFPVGERALEAELFGEYPPVPVGHLDDVSAVRVRHQRFRLGQDAVEFGVEIGELEQTAQHDPLDVRRVCGIADLLVDEVAKPLAKFGQKTLEEFILRGKIVIKSPVRDSRPPRYQLHGRTRISKFAHGLKSGLEQRFADFLCPLFPP